MRTTPLFRALDAVTVPVPSLDEGLRFYRDGLGHTLLWRNDATGQAGLRLPAGDTELVLTTEGPYEPDWLVESVNEAVADVLAAGGRVIAEARRHPGRARGGRRRPLRQPTGAPRPVEGRYVTDEDGNVTGVLGA